MSQTRAYPIQCPQCRHAQDVELYDSINVGQQPELRDALMANRLNAVTCGRCRFSFRVDKPLLYHDPARRLMVYLMPVRESAIERGQEGFRAFLAEMAGTLPPGFTAPEVQLVIRRAELVERIFLREAGLDERVVEYVKHLIYTRNLQRLDPSKKLLLFNAQDSDDHTLYFVVQDLQTNALEGMLQYSREAYNALCEMFDRDEQTPNLLELFPGPYVSVRLLLGRPAGPAPGERSAGRGASGEAPPS